MMRKITAILLCTLLSVTSAGCTQTVRSKDKIRVDVILKTLSTEYWGYMQEGVNNYMKDHPEIEITIKGCSSASAYEEQKTILRLDIESGYYDAIVVAALKEDDVRGMLDDAKIPVVALDTEIEAESVVSYVGSDNELAAYKGAVSAMDRAKLIDEFDEIRCIEIASEKDDTNIEARTAGFKRGIEKYGGIFDEKEIRYTSGESYQAAVAMREIMREYPEGVAIIAGATDDIAMAARMAARSNKNYDNTVFLGFDGLGSAATEMKENPIFKNFVSVAQNPWNISYTAVNTAVKAVRGEEIPETIHIGYDVLNPWNVDSRISQINSNIK